MPVKAYIRKDFAKKNVSNKKISREEVVQVY